MTAEEMKLAIMWHFYYGLHYPLVATEFTIGNYRADILAIGKIVVEVEIKRHLWEITQDLKKKPKHRWYLHDTYIYPDSAVRPSKFYFALPSSPKDIKEKYQKIIPKPYGLIIVKDDDFRPHCCEVVKRGRYIKSCNDASTQAFKEIMSRRLTAENIGLRLKLREKAKK